MQTISKSKFVLYKTCPKSLWLLLNKKEEYVEEPSALKHIEEGKEVGSLAKKYFKDVADTTSYKEDGSLDIENMIGLTNRYLLENKETIAEASFSQDGLFCSVDLLHKVDGGYEIYEVKATTEVEKEHLIDSAFQKYALQKCGLDVVKTYILHLNKNYRRKGGLDLNQLFIKEQIDLAPLFLQTLSDIQNDIESIQKFLSAKQEPAGILLSRCKKCPFMKYCHKDIPVPSVLDINGLRGYDYLNKGIITYNDVLFNNVKLNKRQKTQIDAYLNNKTVSMIMGCLFSSFSSISLFLSNFTIYTCKILIVSFLKRYIFCDFTHFFILTINKEFIPCVRQLCIYKYLVVNNVYA